MSNRSKRLAIFRFCAPLASKLLGCDEELYLCPICGKSYPEESAITGELTLEDVPPRNIDGKGLLLTCKDCNSRAGHKIDYHIKSHLDLQNLAKILTGKSRCENVTCSIAIKGDRFNIVIAKKDNATEVRILEEANDPKKVADLKGYMDYLSESNRWDGEEFNINKRVKLDFRLMKLAFLKSGFLLLTAMLGYRYAFDKRLLVVREQILSPEQDLLNTCFWIEPGKDQSFPKRRIISVSDPMPMFLVTYDESAVILPKLASPTDLYDVIRKDWKQSQFIRFTGTPYEWPERVLMVLDTHVNS